MNERDESQMFVDSIISRDVQGRFLRIWHTKANLVDDPSYQLKFDLEA